MPLFTIRRRDLVGAISIALLLPIVAGLSRTVIARKTIRPAPPDAAPLSTYVLDDSRTRALPMLPEVKVFSLPAGTNGPIVDLCMTGRWLTVVTSRRIVGFDTTSGVTTEWSTGTEGRDVSSMLTGVQPVDARRASVYDHATNTLSVLNPDGRSVDERIALAGNLSQPIVLPGRVVSNTYDTASLEMFDVMSAPAPAVGAVLSPSTHASVARVGRVDVRPYPEARDGIAIHLNRTSLTYSQSEHRLALAYLFVSRIQVFDERGRVERSIAGPREVPLSFNGATRNTKVMAGKPTYRFVPNEDTRFAYLDVAAYRNYLVALFSGRRARAYGEFATFAGDELHVFGWDGRLVGIWRLAAPVQKIHFDEAHDKLYGVAALVQEAQVIEFDAATLRGSTQVE